MHKHIRIRHPEKAVDFFGRVEKKAKLEEQPIVLSDISVCITRLMIEQHLSYETVVSASFRALLTHCRQVTLDGVMPGRQKITTTMVACYAKVKAKIAADLDELFKSGVKCNITLDGWTSKYSSIAYGTVIVSYVTEDFKLVVSAIPDYLCAPYM